MEVISQPWNIIHLETKGIYFSMLEYFSFKFLMK